MFIAPMGREKQIHFIKYSQQSGFPKWLVVKNLRGDLRDVSFIPGSGEDPGEGTAALQFSCWTEEPERVTVHRVIKGRTRGSMACA